MKTTPSPAVPRAPRVEKLISRLVRQNLEIDTPVRSNEACLFACAIRPPR
jgi:hypothetical protein